jgi:Cu(I)/Ag(I) efflux system membrane fusion protein
MKKITSTVLVALLAALLGAAASYLFIQPREQPAGQGMDTSAEPGERQPLYWVAPMDPAYRRDKPGKSPMGMDLVPVYDTAGGDEAEVRISPAVENNLGVRTAQVRHGALTTDIRTVGYVQYDEDRTMHIHPRVEGWVEKLYVKASGDPVQAGQPLYELYSPQLVNAQEELLLALRRDNPLLVEAAQDRLLALQLSPDTVARLKQYKTVQQNITFLAPQTGVVDQLGIREGFFVRPDTTLMSISVLEDVWVEAEIFESQAPLVTVGLPVTMSLDYLPGRSWQGAIDYIYPSLDEQNRTLRVRLRFANEDSALRPNMFVQVVIAAEPVARALLVPRESVIRSGSQDRVVLALGEGRFRSTVVELGQVSEDYAEIRSGLEAGDSVVVSAQFLLDSESSKGADLMRMEAAEPAPVLHRHAGDGDHD